MTQRSSEKAIIQDGLMSGYSEEIVERYFPEESRPVFLSKPLLPGRLAAAVREELDRK